MAGVVLDSSVVIALLTPFDKHHTAVRKAVVETHEHLVIATLTLTEVLVVPAKLSHKACSDMARDLRRQFGEPINLSGEIAMSAASIRATTGLRTPDAIISATATAIGAKLWTCDAALAKAHKGARLIT